VLVGFAINKMLKMIAVVCTVHTRKRCLFSSRISLLDGVFDIFETKLSDFEKVKNLKSGSLKTVID